MAIAAVACKSDGASDPTASGGTGTGATTGTATMGATTGATTTGATSSSDTADESGTSTTGVPEPGCVDAVTAQECATIVLAFDECRWFVAYTLDVTGGVCEFAPVPGDGLCQRVRAGDTDCADSTSCSAGTHAGDDVFWRIGDDGSTQVIHSDDRCLSPIEPWTLCDGAGDVGSGSSGSSGSSSDSTTGAELGPCECGCTDAFG